MIEIGKYNKLWIERELSFGLILSDGQGNEVLLPAKWIPPLGPDTQHLNVFVYLDHEHRPIATTMKPKVLRDQFAYLRVKAATEHGAFLDWGLEKDLFVPFREQEVEMEEGKSYVVYLYLDAQSKRLVGSARMKRFLQKEGIVLEPGEEVDLLVFDRTEIGMRVIVDDKYLGMIYFNEIFRPVKRGDRLKGFVKQVRPDGLVDVRLSAEGLANLEPAAEKILEVLRKSGGFIALTDDSSPDEIRWELQMSKKTFKRAVGILYKERRIRIEPDGIHSTE
jgi:predicted RNA-binding protein (virulence factor B family)